MIEYPTYGLARIEAELKRRNIIVGHTGIYNMFLRRRELNTAKMRLEWVRRLNGEITTLDEIQRDKEKSKHKLYRDNSPGPISKRRHSLYWLFELKFDSNKLSG